MRRMGWERGVAAAVAVVINVMAIRALSVALRSPTLPDTADAVLQALWIMRSPPPPVPSVVEGSTPRTAAPPMRHARTPVAAALRDQVASSTGAATTAEPVAGRSLSAVYLAQARQHAQVADEPFAVRPDPLADRTVRLPGKPAGTFRMREPGSPARAVAMVGMLFGASDPKEPCNSNRARIADLGTAGDSERLQQELDFERRWCRP